MSRAHRSFLTFGDTRTSWGTTEMATKPTNLKPEEKRADGRTATLFRPVLIEASGFTGFCLVKNLSPKGMMGQVYTAFAAGTQVTVQCGPSATIDGVVAWSRDGQVGIEFAQTIDVDHFLKQMGKAFFDGKRSRAPRLEMQGEGYLAIDGRDIKFELKDISQRGLKVQASYVMLGDVVDVKIPGLSPRRATVCWTQGGTARLNFHRALSFVELARWVIDQNCAAMAQGSVQPGEGQSAQRP